jgi:hypothetical protein
MERQISNAASVNDSHVFISMDSGLTWIAREFIRKCDKSKNSIDKQGRTGSEINDHIYISRDSGATWTNFPVEIKILRGIIHA